MILVCNLKVLNQLRMILQCGSDCLNANDEAIEGFSYMDQKPDKSIENYIYKFITFFKTPS